MSAEWRAVRVKWSKNKLSKKQRIFGLKKAVELSEEDFVDLEAKFSRLAAFSNKLCRPAEPIGAVGNLLIINIMWSLLPLILNCRGISFSMKRKSVL